MRLLLYSADFIAPEHFKLCLHGDHVLRERFIKRSNSLYSKTKSAWTCESLGTSYSAFAATSVEEAQVSSSRQAFSS
jgi:hypothetical protein